MRAVLHGIHGEEKKKKIKKEENGSGNGKETDLRVHLVINETQHRHVKRERDVVTVVENS